MDHYQYSNMSMDERILLEIHSLGLYPSRVPDLIHPVDEDISNEISRLQEKHNHQVSRKKTLLNKLLKSTDEARGLQEKDFERLSLEKLTGMAYQKYM
nr:putative histone acetyltransferases subunit 3 [Tanacetum cinerariifolium]